MEAQQQVVLTLTFVLGICCCAGKSLPYHITVSALLQLPPLSNHHLEIIPSNTLSHFSNTYVHLRKAGNKKNKILEEFSSKKTVTSFLVPFYSIVRSTCGQGTWWEASRVNMFSDSDQLFWNGTKLISSQLRFQFSLLNLALTSVTKSLSWWIKTIKVYSAAYLLKHH